MDRRNFLRMMVGGVAASAAVRTWPFRVYSFPSEVKLAPYTVIDGVRCYVNDGRAGTLTGIQRIPTAYYPDESAIFVGAQGIYQWPSGRMLSREIDIEEAKRLFPTFDPDSPFRKRGEVHYSYVEASGPMLINPFAPQPHFSDAPRLTPSAE